MYLGGFRSERRSWNQCETSSPSQLERLCNTAGTDGSSSVSSVNWDAVRRIRTIRSEWQQPNAMATNTNPEEAACSAEWMKGCVMFTSSSVSHSGHSCRGRIRRQRNSPLASCWACSSIGTTWPGSEGRSLRRNWGETDKTQTGKLLWDPRSEASQKRGRSSRAGKSESLPWNSRNTSSFRF